MLFINGPHNTMASVHQLTIFIKNNGTAHIRLNHSIKMHYHIAERQPIVCIIYIQMIQRNFHYRKIFG